MPLSIAAYLKRAAGPLLNVPAADGAAGEALLTDGDGNLSFGNPVPAAHDHDGSYQPLDAELSALAGLGSAANKLPYFTGTGTAALTDVSTAGRALIDDADAAAQRTTLGLGSAATQNTGAFDAAGTAASAVATHESAVDPHPQYLTATEGNAAYQPLDAELTALAGLTSAANKLPYFSGAGAATLADLSSAGRALIDDADSAAQRTTLGLGTAAVEAASAFQPADAQLTDLAALSYAGNALKSLRVNSAATGLEFASVAGGSAEVDINSQSSAYTLQASDLGDLVDFDTAGQTLNLSAAATAGDKFYCWVRYRGAATGVLLVDGNSSETIDGLATITMYAGEVRLLICDGSNWQTVLVAGGYAQFTSSGNFVVPSRIRGCRVQTIGGGGGGGGGHGRTATNHRGGGGGGGGGANSERQYAPGDLGSPGSSITVTVAAQTSPAAGGSGGNGTGGTNGGTSSFGSLVSGYGGGGGCSGRSGGNACGGSGGGTGGTGTQGDTTGVGGGFPGPSTVGASVAGGAGAGSQNAGGAGRHAEFGGASGGGCASTTSAASEGGRSLVGGGAGGGGGGCTAADAETTGAAGGATGDITGTNGGGGTAGALNGGSGGNGTAGSSGLCGQGGGGGGGQDSGTAGAGGDGGAPGGGGGGGGGGTSTGGAGGKGARGECRVWFW